MNPTAKEILDSKAFQKAIANTRDRLFAEWCNEKSQASREALWHRSQATEAVTRELRILAQPDSVAREES